MSSNYQTGAKTPIQFRKAVKRDAKGRCALIGPAGSGKSFSTLKLARRLAGPNGRIACIDTEHGSLSKYADLFDFDVIELDSFSPDNFFAAMDAAEAAGYDVIVIDSLSHFWMGKDGALEYVDNALKLAKGRGNGRADDMAGWKEFRPHERQMIDRMIASPCHVIVTMRVKTAYEEQVNERTGKKSRVKIGLAPVQREGLEYEFDLVGMMNDENELIVDKSRCSAYAGKVIAKPQEKDWDAFAEWLKGEKVLQQEAQRPTQQRSEQPSSAQASESSANRATSTPASDPAPAGAQQEEIPALVQEMWSLMATKKQQGFALVFDGFLTTLRRIQGDTEGERSYLHILGLHGVDSWQRFRSTQVARKCVLAMYQRVLELAPEATESLTIPAEAA